MHRGTRLIVLPMSIALLAGCGGGSTAPGVATADGASTAPAAGIGAKGDDKKFKQCLRENGVDMEAFERGERAGGATDLPAAVEKCRAFLPDGGELPRLAPEELAKVQRYAKCMRRSGVPDFPDPNADGNFGRDWDGTRVLSTEAGEKANATCGKELIAPGG
jgi:hypothetical protein